MTEMGLWDLNLGSVTLNLASFPMHYLLSRWFWYTLSSNMNQVKDKHEEA